MTDRFNGMKHVVRLSTNEGHRFCSHDGCKFQITRDEFEDLTNHYINDHGYVLLHIGTETTDGPKGAPWHATVAVLGSARVPNAKPAVRSRKRGPRVSYPKI
jgi:hypothetical protein